MIKTKFNHKNNNNNYATISMTSINMLNAIII